MTPRTPRLRPALWLPAVLLLLAAGCDPFSTEPELDLTASLEVDATTVTQGQLIRFEGEGTGRALVGMVIRFGEGTQEFREFGGARRATLSGEWSYEEPGTFQMELEAIDGSGLSAMDTVEIQVLEEGG